MKSMGIYYKQAVSPQLSNDSKLLRHPPEILSESWQNGAMEKIQVKRMGVQETCSSLGCPRNEHSKSRESCPRGQALLTRNNMPSGYKKSLTTGVQDKTSSKHIAARFGFKEVFRMKRKAGTEKVPSIILKLHL